jgi:hypothetical protein
MSSVRRRAAMVSVLAPVAEGREPLLLVGSISGG